MGRVTLAGSLATARAARRASSAQGAGESGLSRLIEVHAFSSAGDAAVTVGLAGTLFFGATSGEAQGQTLRFLVLTMLPFAVLAPLIGPLLDRLRHGRRWAIGATLAIRAFLCWVLAGAIEGHSNLLFPIAMAVLIASKAYLVTRSAAAPRLLPRGMTLVKANGRLSLAGVAGAAIGGPLAGLAAKLFGESWTMRVAFLLFVVGTILAILLPARVDSAVGEEPSTILPGAAKRREPIASEVVSALRANAGLRWLSGFLTIFLAFLMRNHPFQGWEHRTTLLLAVVIGAAGLGNAVGTVLGSVLKVASPRVIVILMLVADAVTMVIAAVVFSLQTAVLVGLVAGLGQQLGKLALDSLIQDRIPEHMRTSVFSRSETLLQLSWVLGGIVAVLMPTDRADIGMYTAAVLLVLWAVVVLIWQSGHSIPRPHRASDTQPLAEHGRPAEGRPAGGASAVVPRRAAYGQDVRRRRDASTGPQPRSRTQPQPMASGQRPEAGTRPRSTTTDQPTNRPTDQPFDREETIGISRESIRRYRPADERDDRPRWERDLDEH